MRSIMQTSGAEGAVDRRAAVRRPLVVVFAVCLLAEGAMKLSGIGAPLPLGLAVLLLIVGRGRGWSAQGLGLGSLAALLALAGLRALDVEPARGSPRLGRWHSLGVGSKLYGELAGQAQRYELPGGSLRDGEWVELLPTREPGRPARGPIEPSSPGGPATLELSSDEVRRLAPPPRRGLALLRRELAGWRRAGLNRLGSLDSPIARGLARALLFGDRGDLPAGLADLFTRTGTRHALAVSGLHVALVASLWVWPLGRLLAWLMGALLSGTRLAEGNSPASWLGRAELWRVVILALFAPLAGAQAPVVRATLALTLAQVAGLLPVAGTSWLRRRADGLSLWAFAGWIEWLAAPRALGSLSLQLSYLATLGLIVMGPPLVRVLHARLPAGGRVELTNRAGRRRSPIMRLLAQKLLDFTIAGLAASIAANLATLPLSWWVFGEWSLAGPLATLLILPCLALLLVTAWAWLLLPWSLFELPLTWCAESMVGLLELFDALPGTPLPLPARPGWLLALAGGASFLALARPGSRRGSAARLAALGWGIALCPWWRGARGVELYVLDVGHGTAAVLRAPGQPTWIFDGGSRDRTRVAQAALAPLLRELDVGRVAVALSHGEADHARALGWIVERYPPSLWLGALPAQLAERLPHDCARVDLDRGRVRGSAGPDRGDGEGWSLLRGLVDHGNEGSRSLEFRLAGQRLLLCGDAEGRGLAAQLRLGLLRGPYSLVLFPHHGSETPWLTDFLEAADPGEVWISGSQRPQVAAELDRRGLSWRSTAAEGPLEARWRAPPR